MSRFLVPVLSVALVVLAGAFVILSRQASQTEIKLADTNLRLSVAQANVRALEEQAAQARAAAEVAKAAAAREAQRAKEYDALREHLMKGSTDEPLPEWFLAYLCRLGIGLCVESTGR